MSPAHGLRVGIVVQMAAAAGYSVTILPDDAGHPSAVLELRMPSVSGRGMALRVVVEPPETGAHESS
jgi:hypothetical protein